MKFLLYILTTIIASFYFFPFELKVLPGINSKMVLAGCCLLVIGYNLAKGQTGRVNKDFITLSLWAFLISLCSFIAMEWNNTRDSSFLTYFMSMWVWLGGGYMLVQVIKWVHGGVNIKLLLYYLIAVCVIQCCLALFFQFNPDIDELVNSFMGGEAYMGTDTGDRLHGIGCALDVAGLRFSCVLCGIICLILKLKKSQTLQFYLLISSFLVIFCIGCAISRSTMIGAGLGIAVWIIASFYNSKYISNITRGLFIIGLGIVLMTSLYYISPEIKSNLRFGFEGFFSLAETGKWQTNSTDILENMVVFPDNFKTWIIGDGYAANPSDTNSGAFDPYYIGKSFHGFYMQTDIGYCRYIFYFGILGLAAFLGLFLQTTTICVKRFPQWKLFFMLILLMNLIGWTKVSSDLFLVFAPFLCISAKENEDYQSYRNP